MDTGTITQHHTLYHTHCSPICLGMSKGPQYKIAKLWL